MMTHDEMIAVIQAHKEGKTIEYRYKYDYAGRHWQVTVCPAWNFSLYEYRVKPEPRMFRVKVNRSGDVRGWEVKSPNPGRWNGFLLVKEVM